MFSGQSVRCADCGNPSAVSCTRIEAASYLAIEIEREGLGLIDEEGVTLSSKAEVLFNGIDVQCCILINE